MFALIQFLFTISYSALAINTSDNYNVLKDLKKSIESISPSDVASLATSNTFSPVSSLCHSYYCNVESSSVFYDRSVVSQCFLLLTLGSFKFPECKASDDSLYQLYRKSAETIELLVNSAFSETVQIIDFIPKDFFINEAFSPFPVTADTKELVLNTLVPQIIIIKNMINMSRDLTPRLSPNYLIKLISELFKFSPYFKKIETGDYSPFVIIRKFTHVGGVADLLNFVKDNFTSGQFTNQIDNLKEVPIVSSIDAESFLSMLKPSELKIFQNSFLPETANISSNNSPLLRRTRLLGKEKAALDLAGKIGKILGFDDEDSEVFEDIKMFTMPHIVIVEQIFDVKISFSEIIGGASLLLAFL